MPEPEGLDRWVGPVLIPASDIASRVRSMAAEIDRDHAGQTVRMIVVLHGARVFSAELLRSMQVDAVVDFVTASSYGSGTVSAGRPRVSRNFPEDLVGERVLLVEDIVDTGRTASDLIRRIARQGPESARFASLLSKPSQRECDVRIDYLGFEIPDEFVIGYGMDYRQDYRHLPDIRAVRLQR